ncbi:37028_t:CDS:2 [Gigaspora margarita]|uniref:37028_t:CDS:1 n=1 Tax=Gigaspora margarita TaxID=4874 RepID=A0ABM8W3R3_GIGMA|nr:37028_t:CDS:2 [Gigaspora margarita]
MIKDKKINSIKRSKITNVKIHSLGGYGVVYSAEWNKKRVTLKHMLPYQDKPESEHKSLVNEIEVFCSINFSSLRENQIGYKNIIQCFGIIETKEDILSSTEDSLSLNKIKDLSFFSETRKSPSLIHFQIQLVNTTESSEETQSYIIDECNFVA